MLDRDQIRQLLLHENRDVRYEAGEFFRKCTNPPPDIADTFWASFDRYGIEGSGIGSAYTLISQTTTSSDRLVERLAGQTSKQEMYSLVPAFNQIPVDYLLAHQDHVLAVAQNVPELPSSPWSKQKPFSTSAHLLRRLELRNTDPEQIWDELSRFAVHVEEMARSGWDPRIDQRLYGALLRHPQFTTGKSLAVVNSGETSWLRVFALDLLEALRHRPSIPLFFSILDSDGDCEREAAQKALVAMANPEIIATLQSTFPSAGATHRTMIADTLGDMGLPESERALVALAQRSDITEEDRAWLANAMVDLFTTDGFDLLRQWAKEENYDTSLLDLHVHLPTLAVAIGQELPEAATWPKERPVRRHSLFEKFFGQLGAADVEQSRPHTPTVLEPLPQPVTPHTKVGRNDPCPCGSGKKYKKCCGK